MSRARVTQRVVDEVPEDLGHPFGVNEHVRERVVHLDPELDAERFGPVPTGQMGLVKQGDGVDGLEGQPDLPTLGSGDGREVLSEPREPHALGPEELQRLGVQLGDAILEALEVGVQGGDGCAQLVGDVRQQPATNLLAGIQPGGHLVERAGNLVELRAHARRWNARVEAAAGDEARGRGESRQRRTDPPGQKQADHQGCQGRRTQGDRQRQAAGGAERLLRMGDDLGVGVDAAAEHVLVEDGRPDGARDEPRGQPSCDEHEGEGGQEARAQAASPRRRRRGHSPVPIRYPTPRTVRT